MWKEFRKFIMRGNVIDLAVGVIIGASFTAIVNSIVGDLLTPLIGRITGGLDFSNSLFLALDGGQYASLADVPDTVAVVKFGNFIQAVINFLIVSTCMFFVVKGINKLQDPFKKPAPPAPPKRKCPYCQSEIADEATRCPFCTSELEAGNGGT